MHSAWQLFHLQLCLWAHRPGIYPINCGALPNILFINGTIFIFHLKNRIWLIHVRGYPIYTFLRWPLHISSAYFPSQSCCIYIPQAQKVKITKPIQNSLLINFDRYRFKLTDTNDEANLKADIHLLDWIQRLATHPVRGVPLCALWGKALPTAPLLTGTQLSPVSFFVHAVKYWNKLSVSRVMSSSVWFLKRHVDRQWFNFFPQTVLRFTFSFTVILLRL